MQTTDKRAMVFLGVLVAVAAAVGFTVQQPAYAQLVKDPGAFFFAYLKKKNFYTLNTTQPLAFQFR
jgi:hypothetical protein